jgi:hypothetical protein
MAFAPRSERMYSLQVNCLNRDCDDLTIFTSKVKARGELQAAKGLMAARIRAANLKTIEFTACRMYNPPFF